MYSEAISDQWALSSMVLNRLEPTCISDSFLEEQNRTEHE